MPSFQHFITINSSLFCIGITSNYIYTNIPYLLPIFFLAQDYVMPWSLLHLRDGSYETNEQPSLNQRLMIASMNTLSLLAASNLTTAPLRGTIMGELVFFIPYSLVFEICFDFFHYWTHRLFHNIPYLYKKIHYIHHSSEELNIYTTFQHHVLDVLFTNVMPVMVITILLQPTIFFLNIWFVYKIIEEMFGHMNISSRASCFTQCIWLPRLLGIELYIDDHTTHHRVSKKNFGKRFSLWDKVFGTFLRVEQLEN